MLYEVITGSHKALLLGEVDRGIQLQDILLVEQEEGAALEVVVALEQPHPLLDRLFDVRRTGEDDRDFIKELDLFVGEGKRTGLAFRPIGNQR